MVNRMADRSAAAHRHELPPVELPGIFITSNGGNAHAATHLHTLTKLQSGGGNIVKSAHDTATTKAYGNVTTVLSVAVLFFIILVQETFWRDHTALDITWTAVLTMVGTILVIGSWYGKGGPAWTTARLMRRHETPDGPRGWPILGSWRLMQGSTMHRELADLAWNMSGGNRNRQLMSLSVGATRIVLTSDPTVAKQILQSPTFADRPLKRAAADLGFARAIGFAPQGDYWRYLRKLAVTHIFSHKQITRHHQSLQHQTSRLIEAIETSLSRTGTGIITLRPFLQRAAVNNITSVVFGREFEFGSSCYEAEKLEGLIREGFELLGAFNWADHVPMLHRLPFLPFARRCRDLSRRVRDFIMPILEERRPRSCGDGDAFVDVLLGLEGEQKMSDEDMVSVLWEMVFRGTDTIAVLTEWALAELILNPDIQASLHKELDAVVGRASGVHPSDIDRLPYLQAVLKEALRAHPPGPLLSWARIATHDAHIAGYHIPQHTTAMVNMWAITHDPRIWPEPHLFNPGRFLGVELDVLGTDLRLAPFGSGRRVCPGRALGVATAQLWLARLVHQFQWEQDAYHPVLLTENLKLSCEMASPLRARAVIRIPHVQ